MHPNAIPLLLAALLGLSQCKKIDPTPPPTVSQLDLLPLATQTGQRTFGCLVNGQAWTPAGSPFAGPLFTAQYYNNQLTLVATRGIVKNGQTISDLIQLNINRIDSPGQYILSRPDTSFVNYHNLVANCTYYTDATHPATVVITKLDLVNRIVSGTFAFTLETPACGKVVVTDGRFDSRF
ncbi:hypothetical protein GKZ68_20520 (plasmid) [Hymenobacter sp. BRD128]|uniref:DUF6252 family protein n=1 Tax=Hymenobacter sp. BRD128 TaxID=2675878 RepID=UPI001564407B|nr:DUF6252 family protein [Hymenobacter sp. BRD128]QKG59069.1 hypothetical protein GKZ68_20520 [Hymenobacter sp. BRD128]